MDAVPAAFKTIVWFPPPLTVQVTVALGVPVKMTVPDPFGQTDELPDIATVGNGFTVIIAEPDCDCVHTGVPDEAALAKLNVAVDA